MDLSDKSIAAIFEHVDIRKLYYISQLSERLANLMHSMDFGVQHFIADPTNYHLWKSELDKRYMGPFQHYDSRFPRVDFLSGLKHLLYIFKNLKITGIHIKANDFSEIYEFILSHQTSVKRLVVFSPKDGRREVKVTAEDAELILKTMFTGDLAITSWLDIKFDFPEDFKFDFKNLDLSENFQQARTTILKSHWFTFDNLFEIRCSKIRLLKSTLSDDQINEFLKMWKNREIWENFRSFSIETELPPVEEKILNGLNCLKIASDENRRIEEHETDVSGGFDIFRNDGVRGTIEIKNSWFATALCVNFYVW